MAVVLNVSKNQLSPGCHVLSCDPALMICDVESEPGVDRVIPSAILLHRPHSADEICALSVNRPWFARIPRTSNYVTHLRQAYASTTSHLLSLIVGSMVVAAVVGATGAIGESRRALPDFCYLGCTRARALSYLNSGREVVKQLLADPQWSKVVTVGAAYHSTSSPSNTPR